MTRGGKQRDETGRFVAKCKGCERPLEPDSIRNESCLYCGKEISRELALPGGEGPPDAPIPDDPTVVLSASDVLIEGIEKGNRDFFKRDLNADDKVLVIDSIFAINLQTQCELAKYVHLAAAKRCYEDWRPETKQGATGRAGKSSDGHQSFIAYASAKIGIKPNTIGTWCAIGEKICQGAYVLVLGTPMANVKKLLSALSCISSYEQIHVANLNRVYPARALRTLYGYYRRSAHWQEKLKEQEKERLTPDEIAEDQYYNEMIDESENGRLRHDDGAGPDACAFCHGSGRDTYIRENTPWKSFRPTSYSQFKR